MFQPTPQHHSFLFWIARALYHWAKDNPVEFGSFLIGAQYFWGVFVQSLKAPTATSGQAYVSFFALANASASNWKRAAIPKVEDSPNWQDAVQKHCETLPGAK